MRIITLCISLFIFAGAVQAQEQDNVISINSSATVQVPADKIAFNITINAEAETPQKAFDIQKKREQVLLELLKGHDISEKNINFEPISISQANTGPEDRRQVVRTRQNVTLYLTDFSKYEDIQITLIENSFDDFNGRFMSTESKSGQDKALTKALETAKQKAKLIAEQSGLELAGIKTVSYSHNQSPRPMRQLSAFSKSGGSLVSEYDQTVNISASVAVQYNFVKVVE